MCRCTRYNNDNNAHANERQQKGAAIKSGKANERRKDCARRISAHKNNNLPGVFQPKLELRMSYIFAVLARVLSTFLQH